MKFAFGTPALILYPAIVSPWEPAAGGAEILRVARKADALGFDWLTVSEHIVMPEEMVEAMGARFPEALTAAAVLAGATERIRLLTYVLVLPYRNPVVLAKQIATLDFLTGGRFTLGTASGHLEREFEVLGIPYEERGRRTDEALRVMRALWTGSPAAFRGEFVQFERVAFEPKPIQKPHPPIFIGGNSRRAMRRAAAFGDGWLPWLVTREDLPGCLRFLRDQPGFAERAASFEVVMPLATFQVEDYTHRELGETHLPSKREEVLEEIGLLRDAGATVIQVPPPRTADCDQLLAWLDWFGEEVIPTFRG
jgi:probable F420-dependent oxidoreductase